MWVVTSFDNRVKTLKNLWRGKVVLRLSLSYQSEVTNTVNPINCQFLPCISYYARNNHDFALEFFIKYAKNF